MLVIRDRIGHTEILTLNRPEAANSLNPPLLDELDVALREILDDGDARAVVLTGAGDRVFCAGMDLTTLGSWDAEAAGDAEGPIGRTVGALLAGAYPKPLIAAVNGAAVGGGLELVLACDLVVAAEHARFGLPEVRRGLYAAGGGTLLSTRMPLALALEIGLTGKPFDAGRAAGAGLVNRVVPAGDLLAAATELAGEIAANGPLAVQLTKSLLRAAVTDGPGAGMATPEQQQAIFASADAKEGATAFMEKRTAVFVGR